MRAWGWAALLLALCAAPAGAQTAAVAPPLRLGDYLDTAALRTHVAALPAPRAEKRIARVFRLVFDSVGKPLPPVPAVPRVMPAHYRDAVAPLIQAALRPIDPRLKQWGMFILVESGNPARVEEILPEQRMPRVANIGQLTAAISAAATALADSGLAAGTLTPRVLIEVSEEGAVSSARIERSSGIANVDATVLRIVSRVRFTPLLLDGEPAPARVVLPIRLIIEGDPEPAAPKRP